MDFQYEVETRFVFNDLKEVYTAIPEIEGCLINDISWISFTHGIQLFKKDILLRTSEIMINNDFIGYLGYKKKDTGNYCNIRLERDEDITKDTDHSIILDMLGIKYTKINHMNIKEILKESGYDSFMEFSGTNLSGACKELDISVKAMTCAVLNYPLILEIEKTVKDIDETNAAEEQLKDIIKKYRLENRVVRKEPPTLLFEKIFSK